MHAKLVISDANVAAATGDLELLKCLTPPQLMAVKDRRGWRPLHHAVDKGQVEATRFLAQAGLWEALDNDQSSPLHCAVAHPQCLQELLTVGLPESLIDAKNKFGCTALMLAAAGGHTESVCKLLDANASLDNTDKRSLNALGHAIQNGQSQVVDALLQRPECRESMNAAVPGRPLHLACRNGQRIVAEQLIDGGAEINGRLHGGATPLWEAAKAGHHDVVTLLIDRGASITSAVTKGPAATTALFEASKGGHAASSAALLARMQSTGARSSLVKLMMRTCGRDKQTSFHAAAVHGHAGVLTALLEAEDIMESTPVLLDSRKPTMISMMSMKGGSVNVAEGSNLTAVDKRGRTALHLACAHDKPEAVKVILAAQKVAEVELGVDETGKSALHVAAEIGSAASVSAILESLQGQERPPRIGVGQLDYLGETALLKACRGGYAECAAALLEAHRADADIVDLVNHVSEGPDGSTPLIEAIRFNHIELVDALLACPEVDPAQIDRLGWSGMHVAAYHNAVEIIGRLLAAKAPPDAPGGLSGANTTPLHRTCCHGQLDAFRALVTAGADPKAVDGAGLTALHYAAESGVAPNPCVAECLLKKHGLEFAAKNVAGETPLLIAARKNHVDFCRLLLEELGCGADERNAVGQTALHLACGNGSTELVQVLMVTRDWRELLGATDRDGGTPVFMAVLVGAVDLVSTLLAAGADKRVQTRVGAGKDSLLHQAVRLHLSRARKGVDYLAMIAVLLREGVPAQLVNAADKTAYELAVEAKDADATAVFQGGY